MGEQGIHYVKFVRGSMQAWEYMLSNNRDKISDDTLYFIYDKEDQSTGKLFLGTRLISDGLEDVEHPGSSDGSFSLSNLEDVTIDEESLKDFQILTYDEDTQSWVNTDIEEIINSISVSDMVGASADADGKHGLVPAPKQGDEDKFLKGDGTWADVDVPEFEEGIFTKTETGKLTLNGYEAAPAGSYPIKTEHGVAWQNVTIGGLSREIVSSIDDISSDGNENKIYFVPNDREEENNVYDEYMYIGGKIERVGVGSLNLDGYVKTADFNLFKTTIGNLNELIFTVENKTLVEEVNSINERMRWQDLDELIKE